MKNPLVAGGVALMSLMSAGTLPGVVSPASAHPHVWVSVETTVLVEKGTITGFRHKWSFDEFYTAMAIQGLDTNKDGIYSREELAELAQVNIEGLKDFKFFTFAKLGAAELELDAPKDYWLTHAAAPKAEEPKPAASNDSKPNEKGGVMSRVWNAISGGGKKASEAPAEPAKVLTLEFTLPLKQPVLVEAQDFSFAVYDPSWFIAFDIPDAAAIKLAEGAPAGCKIESGEAQAPENTADDAKKLGEAFSGQFGGASTTTLSGSKLFKVNCGPRS